MANEQTTLLANCTISDYSCSLVTTRLKRNHYWRECWAMQKIYQDLQTPTSTKPCVIENTVWID